MDISSDASHDIVQFAALQQEMLEALFGREWFTEAKGHRLQHPAYRGWELCNQIIEHGGIKKREQLLELGKLALDSMPLFDLTGSDAVTLRIGDLNLIAGLDFLKKLRADIRDPEQYDDRRVELYIAGWYRARKLQMQLLLGQEGKRTPDLRVLLEVPNIPMFLECKRLRGVSARHIQRAIREANQQLRQARWDVTPPPYTPVPYGVAVLDITSAIGLDSIDQGGMSSIVAEAIRHVHDALSTGNYTSVHYVLVVWDIYNLLVSDSGDVVFVGQRISYPVKHPTTIPPFPPAEDGRPMAPLFETLIEGTLFSGYDYGLRAILLGSDASAEEET